MITGRPSPPSASSRGRLVTSVDAVLKESQFIEAASATSSEENTGSVVSTVLADTFLIHTFETSESPDDMRDYAWQADLEDTTTVRIRRTNAGSASSTTSTHSIQVVECQDSEWDVQREAALTLAAAVQTDSITAIDQARSIIIPQHNMSNVNAGRNNSTNGSETEETIYGAEFSADDEVTFTRRTNVISNSIVSYEVVQFVLPSAGGGRIMSSLAASGGLAGPGGIAGPGGGLAA